MAEGIWLSEIYKQEISPLDVAKVLARAEVRYVLVGAHAANNYTGQPRTTRDVDVIAQFPKKACVALLKQFPKLVAHDTPVVIRFKTADEGKEAIDVIKPSSSKLFRRLLKLALVVKIDRVAVHIPPLEGVLAAKFAAMVSLTRQLVDRHQDAIDMVRMVQANKQIDLDLVRELGNLVFEGGGKELLTRIDHARNGKMIRI